MTSPTWKAADAAQKDDDAPASKTSDDESVVGGVASCSPTSRGARRRKGVALRRIDVSHELTEGPRSHDDDDDHPRAASPRPDRRGFVECRHCRIGFRDRVTYTLHMGYHGYEAPFSCNMCGHQSADRVAFFLHIATAAH